MQADGQMKSSSNVHPQVSTQTLQPLAASPSGVISAMTRSRFRWSYALFAVGFLAVSGAGTAVLFKVLSETSIEPCYVAEQSIY